MVDDPVLLNDWHVVARATDLNPGEVRGVRLLGRDLALWRNDDGFHAWFDLCIHRGARLSRGRVEKECLICPYHGWVYNSEGTCTLIPAHPNLKPPARANAQVYHVQEKYGLVWVCLGTPEHEIGAFPEWTIPRSARRRPGPTTSTPTARACWKISSMSATSPSSTPATWAIRSGRKSWITRRRSATAA
ncbi:MAG: Rieske (2Fe-2S) protein [Verrucomicrobiota bacterium]